MYKLSFFLVLTMGIFAFGVLPNVGISDIIYYNTEKEIEETEQEAEKYTFAQYEIGQISEKGKNVLLYDFHIQVQHSILAVWKEAINIFFEINTERSPISFILPTLTSISPRYILFHRLVFYN